MDNKFRHLILEDKVYYIIGIAVLIAILFFYGHYVIGTIGLLLYGSLIIYSLKNTKMKQYSWQKFIKNFSMQLDIATTNMLVKLPFPSIIVSKKGKILWYNQSFLSTFKENELIGKNINEIIPELKIDKIANLDQKQFKYMNINNSFYDIFINIITTSEKFNDEIVLLYFYDVTEKFKIKKGINDEKDAVILIEVDNLDEVLKSIEEDRRPLFIAEIERNLNSYAQNINGIIIKNDSNKYVIITQEKYLDKEIDKKFEILDIIRELDLGNKLEVTLSIGVGRGGATPQENHEFAISAKELALGRGGDQAVVKKNDKLLFFGGKTKEVEKRTKVRARVIARALVDLINESSNVVIMGHVNPDIDCLGAAVGICSVINLMGNKCYMVLDSINNSIKQMMDKINKEKSYNNVFITSSQCKNIIDDNTLLILVDVHSKSYVLNDGIVSLCKRIVIVDHHRKSKDFIKNTLLSYIEPYASSTSELVTEMIQYMIENPKIKQIEAEALLAGICVDTKNFCFKTGVRTFEAASFLRKLGADTIDVKKMFSNDLETYIKKANVIESAKVFNNMAIAICPPNIEDNVLAAQAADELLNITGIQASFVIVKIEGDTLISGRSLGEVNVQLILESLGGGGHMTMAGARLKNMTTEEVVQKLKDAIDKYLMEGE